MKIEKVSLSKLIETEIFRLTSERFQKNIKNIYKDSDSFFLIKANNFENGLYFLKPKKKTLNVKLFISKDNFDFKLLKSKIIEEAKSFKLKFLQISHFKNSKNVFDKFNKFDSMLQYERVQNQLLKEIPINPDFSVSDSVINYDELTNFFKLVFAEDEDYYKANWDSMIRSFSNFKLLKVESVIRNKDEIIGAIIGVKIPVLNKFYLHTIGVHPKFRGKQLGRKLMFEFLSKTENLNTYLDVLESAKIPRKLYENFDFKLKKVNSIYSNVDNL